MPSFTASAGYATLVAVDDDRAAVDRVGAEDGAGDFGAAGAHQAGKAEDLALAHREADVLGSRPRLRPLDAQTSSFGGRLAGRGAVGEFAADHHAMIVHGVRRRPGAVRCTGRRA
jgi:hypothetical protein